MAAKRHDSRCALSANPMPINGECWCDLWLNDDMDDVAAGPGVSARPRSRTPLGE